MSSNFYNPNQKNNYLAYFLIGVVAFVLGWQATVFGIIGDAGQLELSKDGDFTFNSNHDPADLELFWTVWAELHSKYVDKSVLDEEKMVYGAIAGMVDALDDPYTVFMTPSESEEFDSSLNGTLEGIGAELTVEDKNLVIVSPLRQSPAEKAGLLAGDIIYKIEDEYANDMSLLEAVMKIRGEKGSTVHLTIIREDVAKPFEVSIVRDSIDIESVTVEKLDDDIVYISVNQFNDKTNEEFGRAVSELILNEPKGLIVDLRFNGGGYLDIAVELLSYLLPSKTEAVILKEKGKDDETLYTNGNPKILDVPLVVMVNGGSASASEIVAGAVQDHERGVLLGTQSFGKGSVQEVESFADGSSIRMTIAKWFTPSERSIDKVGLTPDIIVEISDEDVEAKFDSQKQAAIDYLKGL